MTMLNYLKSLRAINNRQITTYIIKYTKVEY